MLVCIRPSARLFFLGPDLQGQIVVAMDGSRRRAFGPLSAEDRDVLDAITGGRDVDPDATIVKWLIHEQLAEGLVHGTQFAPTEWPAEASRQMSAYSTFVGIHGAARLNCRARAARVFVAGLGGIGCNVIQQLLRIGVSQFTLVDPDHVEKSNLNRQILYRYADIGSRKTDAARRYIMQSSQTGAEVTTICGDFLTFCPPDNVSPLYDLAVISGDSDPLRIRRHAARIFYERKIPYGFASYSGDEATLGPLVFHFNAGCGCCSALRVEPEGSLQRIDGPAYAQIPPSSFSTNAMLAAMFVDRWLRSILRDQGTPETYHITLSGLDVRREESLRLQSCPVCGV